MTVEILVGDCRETLAGLEPGRFHTCVTSPPYWALRDYGTEPLDWPAIAYAPLAGLPPCVEVPAMRCSLGLEPTLEAFIGHMVLVFREVRRVLRDDGTLWLNMGDSYAGARRGPDTGSTLEGTRHNQEQTRAAQMAMTASRRRDDEPIPRSDVVIPGLKPKDLVGQPWRLAFALQADGWWLRSDVIWHKKNPMPESTKDRPTKAHEYVFLLSKSERYYYDADAIKEPSSPDTHARYASAKGAKFGMSSWEGRSRYEEAGAHGMLPPGRKPVGGWQSGAGSHTAIEHQQPDDSRHGKLIAEPTAVSRSKYGPLTGQDTDGAHRTKAGLPAPLGTGVGWGHGTDAEARGRDRVLGRVADRPDGAYEDGKSERMGRGPGWRERKLAEAGSGTKNNDSFDAAMAVMPADRNKRSVWTMPTEGYKGAHFATFPTKLVEPCILAGTSEKGCCPACGAPWKREGPGEWQQGCACEPQPPVPCRVLDNFGGSATTGLVADRLGRDAVLCELNPTYAGMGERRIAGDRGHVARQQGIPMEAP